MTDNLHIKLLWLEERVTAEKRRELEAQTEKERLNLCRALLRKNSTAVGMRKQEVDALDAEGVWQQAEALYGKYRHYIDRMEGDAPRGGRRGKRR